MSAPAEAKSTKNDQAPPPPAVPVLKVDEAPLVPLDPDKIEGTAQAVDGDEIRVGDSVVRLYGIAAPDMSAPKGPEARAALDGKVNGQRVSCKIFGKVQATGDALGQCLVGTEDPAVALLSQGLAAVYRSSNGAGADQQALSQQYDAAETKARQQGLGLWKVEAPLPAPSVPVEPVAKPFFTTEVIVVGALLLLVLAILSVPITQLSIARATRRERLRDRETERVTLSSGLAAEAEIIRATARYILDQTAAYPADKPIPGAIAGVLGLPGATYWRANGERLHTLPVEVAIPLLRLHALQEDAARKLAAAGTIPKAAVAATLTELAGAAERAIAALETSLGIVRETVETAAEAPAAATSA
jgi:endonuclease YncB( thermonuclease family)